MDKDKEQELLEFLQKNMSIEIEANYETDFGESYAYLTVKLYIGDKCISSNQERIS